MNSKSAYVVSLFRKISNCPKISTSTKISDSATKWTVITTVTLQTGKLDHKNVLWNLLGHCAEGIKQANKSFEINLRGIIIKNINPNLQYIFEKEDKFVGVLNLKHLKWQMKYF